MKKKVTHQKAKFKAATLTLLHSENKKTTQRRIARKKFDKDHL